MDAPSGYHQMHVNKAPQHKIAFSGPNGKKYTYNVMPFGPANGPVIFILFIHDINQLWQEVTTSLGIAIDAATNAKIMIDNIFSWAPRFKLALKYLRCQLKVCRAQNPSLGLKKSFFFPSRIEFFGHDVCDDGNRPAQSKDNLLKTWPKFQTVRDVASSIGYIIFYASDLLNTEVHMSKL